MDLKPLWNAVSLLFVLDFPSSHGACSGIVTCETDFSVLNHSITTLNCPANCWKRDAALCGIGVYAKGPVCLAAMQEKLIDASGGLVQVYRTSDHQQTSLSGGSQAGVTSTSCSTAEQLYSFRMTCSTDGDTQRAITQVSCPSCQGRVYPCGTDAYHVNSSLCAAAIHARKIPTGGGDVRVFKYTNGRNIHITNTTSTNKCSVASWFTFVDVDACSFGYPCLNQGTCVNLLGGYACVCGNSFSGPRCEKAVLLKVVCEYKSATVRCPGGSVISVVDGFYGRSDYSTCPGNAFTVDCVGAGTLDVLKATCDGKNSCTLLASNTVFGDPCQLTNKYIKMHYVCV